MKEGKKELKKRKKSEATKRKEGENNYEGKLKNKIWIV